MGIVVDEIVEFEAEFVREIYHNDDFYIVAMSIDPFKYPDIELGKFGTVTVLGENLFKMNENVTYKMKCRREEGKYGTQYRYITCYRDLPATPEQTKSFLNEVLTPTQAETLLNAYPDVLNIILSGNVDEINVNNLKGIKEKTLQRIIDKVEENFGVLDMFNVFFGILPINVLTKLKKEYKSVEKVEEKLSTQPYETLYRLDRTGFKTADKILLEMEAKIKEKEANGENTGFKFEFDLRESQERCRGAVTYYLAENEEEGSTCMLIADLITKVRAYCPEAMSHVKDIIVDENNYYIDRVEKTITLRDTYEKERNIIETLFKANLNPLKWGFNYEKYKESGGFTMTEEQIRVFDAVCNNNFAVLTGNGGCVDCDTEFFNGREWKRISDWESGESVLQYNDDGSTELVVPEIYHKYPCDQLWQVKDSKIDMCLSDEHNVVFQRYGKLEKITMGAMREVHESNPRGFMGRFINTYNSFGKGVDISDDRIKLISLISLIGKKQIDEATGADTALRAPNGLSFRFIRDTLSNNNIMWKEVNVPDEVTGLTDYADFIFNCAIPDNTIPSDWYDFSADQFKIFVDVVLNICGKYYQNARHINVSNKQNSDFIQWAFTVSHYTTTIKFDEDARMYDIAITPRNYSSLEMVEDYKTKGRIIQYNTVDGFKYCFTVPSHMWVMRRNGVIVVTGNSGKTQTVKSVVDMLKDNRKSFAMAAPTAKAAQVIKKYTGIEAQTIHRLLVPNHKGGFIYNERNKLPYDMIIIDETSMIDNNLCDSLLKAIDFRNTKLMFVGDPAQLSPVGTGNILHDIIDSGDFPVVGLTKIFRYNEGGLIKVTTDIRNCKRYLNNCSGMQNFGDGYVFVPKNQEDCVDYAVRAYEKLVKKYGHDNVMFLSAQNIGDYGSIIINKKIQEQLNKNDLFIEVVQYGEKVKFKLNDVVIMKKNTYDSDVCDEDGFIIDDPVLIANGESGIITLVKNDGVVIKYGENYIWTPKKILKERINLGYCISIHSSQGSQCDNVIIITPPAHSFMSNSNLLYVATSRSKERCLHIGSKDTINRAIRKKQEDKRMTNSARILERLKDQLEGEQM